MTRFLLRSMAVAALVGGATSAVMAFPHPLKKGADPLGRMKKVEIPNRWSKLDLGKGRMKVAPNHSSEAANAFQYLTAPDGSTWYATTRLDTDQVLLDGGLATEDIIKGYEFTIFDSDFNEIGKIRDKVRFEEGETKCAKVMLDMQVTQKFFNYDAKYEVMVAVCMNAADYTVNTRTKAYSIGGEKDDEGMDIPVNTIDGYAIDAVNMAPDAWGEQYYISFYTETSPSDLENYPAFIDYLKECRNVITTYRRSGSDSEPSVFNVHETPQLCLPGDQMDSPMMLSKNVDGKFTMVFSRYEKSFFVDPTGWSQDESMTPDNNLVITIYQQADKYAKSMDLIQTTSIPCVQNTEDSTVIYTFYGIGNLMYADDVDFTHYTSDGRAAFIVTADEYRTTNDDMYNSAYRVYDADGKMLMTLAENTENFLMMSDIPGHEPQAMFVHTLDDFCFEFVDLYSGTKVLKMDQIFEGESLSTTMDRVPTADGYLYAISYGYAMDGGNEDVIAPVGWFDTNGDLVRLDKINTGKGVEMAQIYIERDALSPYVFNTDDNLEYLVLVKRGINGDTALREELLIVSPGNEPIETFLPDESKGPLSGIYLDGGSDPKLTIIYRKDWKYTTDIYNLPFTCFAGGDGTVANPYQIATAGDLAQVRKYPSACYEMTNDIDCSGVSFTPVHEFSGVIDGKGHNINNLSLYGTGNTGLIANSYDAAFKNMTFNNAKINLEGDGDAGVLVANATNSKIDNIQIRKLTVNGDKFGGAYGSIAGRLWRTCEMKGCGVAGADINLPNCPNAGGLVGEMRTGSTVSACAFTGNITANNTLGGIVGTTTLGDESITNCHVDANLKAENTIGGIVGFSKRSAVEHCYAEGTIEATKANKWNNSYGLGGIVGELEGDWEGKANVPVKMNYVGISSITYPDTKLSEMWPNQLSTVHRVVGRTSFNAEPEIKDYNEDGSPIYKKEVIYEGGVQNNMVLDGLACIDPQFDESTVEGESINKNDVGVDTLEENLGFAFGTTSISPWQSMGWFAYDPSLYFENIMAIFENMKTVAVGENFTIDMEFLTSNELSEEDVIGSFMCDFSEDLMEMTGNMTYTNGVLSVEFKAIAEGEAIFHATMMTGSATCIVNITDGSQSGVLTPAATQTAITCIYGAIYAAGCDLALYSAGGQRVKTGHGSIDTSSLEKGVYVAVARTVEGQTFSRKIAVK